MKLKIEIELDNAAFGDNYEAEIIRIVQDIINRLPERIQPMPYKLGLMDINGNKCGTAQIVRSVAKKKG